MLVYQRVEYYMYILHPETNISPEKCWGLED